MENNKIDRLVEVLSVPTYSKNESRLIKYLEDDLTKNGYSYTKDDIGNIFVTKGVSNNYPLFVAHTDTVHRVDEDLTIKRYNHNDNRHKNKLALTGYNSKTNEPSGCGGDDKCGVYLALEMLDHLENVKVAFFVSEEIGCIGSNYAVKYNKEFFSDVGYAIQYDSPEGDSLSATLMGKELFETSKVFRDKVSGLILEHGIDKWERHPYTDIWPMLENFDYCCLNLAAGYYKYHTSNEYVIVDDVQNAFDLGVKLFNVLGENKYERGSDETVGDIFFDHEEDEDEIDFDDEMLLIESEGSDLVSDDEIERYKSLASKEVWTVDDWEFYDDYRSRFFII